MTPKLSIIIPCYNSKDTVEEAIYSVYKQGFKDDEFEIVLVDDKSTDNTLEVLEKIKSKYSNIKLLFHNENKGGGATRNTAVLNSISPVIFCLDSDDVLPPDTLDRMYKMLIEGRLDGVTFSGAYTFKERIENFVKVEYFDNKEERLENISLNRLLEGKSWPAGANFMYTREAFEKSGGYPYDHPLDTQGFGFRFIVNNLKVRTLTDSYFYQRQFTKNESYFERSFKSGLFSISYYLILKEYIEVFCNEIQEDILNYDIFSNNNQERNLLDFLIKKYRAFEESDKSFFSNEYLSKNEFILNFFGESERNYKNSKFYEALTSHIKNEKLYLNMYFDTTRYYSAYMNNKYLTIEKYTDLINKSQIIRHNKNYFRLSILSRVKRKVRKIFQNFFNKQQGQ